MISPCKSAVKPQVANQPRVYKARLCTEWVKLCIRVTLVSLHYVTYKVGVAGRAMLGFAMHILVVMAIMITIFSVLSLSVERQEGHPACKTRGPSSG